MNKELILKYKIEFDHSLYGGKLQVKFVNDPWEEAPEDIFSYSTVNFVLVIDDAYIELRKALAEGKIIQLNEAEKFSDQNRGWVDLSCTSLGSSTNLFPVEYYRIKPEEPKFKVGDWVRDGKNIYQFIEPSSIYSYESSLQRCELWQPKPGEFCWFLNESKTHPTLATFTNKSLGLYYSDISNDGFDFCEPFIGQLPTTLGNCK